MGLHNCCYDTCLHILYTEVSLTDALSYWNCIRMFKDINKAIWRFVSHELLLYLGIVTL